MMDDRKSYYLYNNKLSALLLTLTIIATQVGGGMIMGVADAAYKMGFAGLFYPIGIIMGLLIIALGFGGVLKKADVPTISAIFEKKYKFPAARKFASIISSASLFSITIAQGVAIRHLLYAIGWQSNLYFILIWMSVISYTAIGGIKVVVRTNVIQILFITMVLGLLLFSTVNNVDFSEVNVAASNMNNYYSVLEWLIWPCCYTLIEQDMAQLFFSAKSSSTVKKSAIAAAICIMILAMVPAIIGIIARSQFTMEPQGILLFFAKNNLSHTIYTLTALAVILAITSTVDSLLCAISSNVAYDFSVPRLKQKYLSSNMIITFIIGIASLVLIYYCENIINVIMFSYGLCVSGLFIPAMCGFLLPTAKLKKSAATLSIIAGIVSFVWLSIIGSHFTYVAIIISAAAYFAAMLYKKH